MGTKADLRTDRVALDRPGVGSGARSTGPLLAQASAHGEPRPCRVEGNDVVWDEPSRRVAPGQSVVLYEGDEVVGAGQVA